jgi:hypothetical protein
MTLYIKNNGSDAYWKKDSSGLSNDSLRWNSYNDGHNKFLFVKENHNKLDKRDIEELLSVHSIKGNLHQRLLQDFPLVLLPIKRKTRKNKRKTGKNVYKNTRKCVYKSK